MVELCEKYSKKFPVRIVESNGYLITVFKSDKGIIVHMLAEDYDTDIDHHLDEIRFHRSRVNFVNKVEPVGVSRSVRLESKTAPKVFTPFNSEDTVVADCENGYDITLPEKTSYAILYFEL